MFIIITALDTEGIFRIPGSVAEVNELMRAFDEGICYFNNYIILLRYLLPRFFILLINVTE